RRAVRHDREAVAPNLLQEIDVARHSEAGELPFRVGEETEAPLGGEPRIEQLEASGCRVAAVGEQALASFLLELVEPGELAVRHVGFSPYLDLYRSIAPCLP